MFQSLKVFLFRKYYQISSRRAWKDKYEPGEFSILHLPLADEPRAAYFFASPKGADRPLMIYFHGGGWVIGDLDTHRACCQIYSERTGCSVLSVDYRLAPEHPYPAAHDDALNATEWLAEHMDRFGPNNGQIILAGDSAGANLATCTCLELGERARAKIVGEIVIYPVTQHYKSYSASYREKAKAKPLSSGIMHWFWNTYLGGEYTDETLAKRSMPMLSRKIASLPPTFLVTAEEDPLRDEGIAYAKKIHRERVPLKHRHFDKAAHGFACSEGPTDDFNSLVEDLEVWVADLAKPS